jgi:hypothetical protein
MLLVFCAFGLPGRSSPNSGFVVGEADGGIIATQYDQSGSVGYTYNADAQECDIKVPCFEFRAGSGAAPSARIATGCTPSSNPDVTECPSAGVTSIRIVIRNSGTVTTQNGDPGGHNGDCSPARVTLVGTRPGPNSFAVYDGCAQTIVCATSVDTVEADAKDTIQGKCGYVQKH